MHRRRLLHTGLTLASLGLLAGCRTSPPSSVQRVRLHRIGCLLPFTPTEATPMLDAFRQGLREHGYVEGHNIELTVRSSEARRERLPELVAELVRDQVDVILTATVDAIRAAQQATTAIPIVFAASGDPVAEGFVTSLARPGGNITGLTTSAGEENAKRWALFKDAVPGLSRVAILWNQSSAGQFTETERAAQALGLQVLSLEVQGSDALDAVLAAAIAGGADGLLMVTTALFAELTPPIAAFAVKHRLPAAAAPSAFAHAGGLMAYGTNALERYRRAAAVVDKILKGAKPGDLPVERPTEYDFVINLTTARSFGLTIPPGVLSQATEVIR